MEDVAERRFLIVAGEASGDRHAARLIEALRRLGNCRVRGVTGPALEAAGAERAVPMERIALIGFSAILPRLPGIWRAYRRVLAEYRSFRPHVCVLVDSPGFNFRLGPALKLRGARIFYYIAPQVWAWHPERAARMARWVDRLAVVFPFEESLFRNAGVKSTFVGHPLIDELEPEVDEETLRRELGLRAGERILGLLPGSRQQELRAHARPMLEAATMLMRGRPDLLPVVALGAGLPLDSLSRPAAVAGVRIVQGRTRAIQAFAVCCAVASGTATLETALFGTPLAIVYRVGALNYEIARRVVKLRRIGLPNIVAGSDVAPELIQRDFTAGNLARTLAPWLDDSLERQSQCEKLTAVRGRLGGPGASARAASLLWSLAQS